EIWRLPPRRATNVQQLARRRRRSLCIRELSLTVVKRDTKGSANFGASRATLGLVAAYSRMQPKRQIAHEHLEILDLLQLHQSVEKGLRSRLVPDHFTQLEELAAEIRSSVRPGRLSLSDYTMPFMGAAVAHDGANCDGLLGWIASCERFVLLE